MRKQQLVFAIGAVAITDVPASRNSGAAGCANPAAGCANPAAGRANPAAGRANPAAGRANPAASRCVLIDRDPSGRRVPGK